MSNLPHVSNFFRSSFKAALFWGILLVFAQGVSARTATSADGIRLQPLPTHIFKTPDPGHEATESWAIWLLLETTKPRKLTVQAAKVELLAGKEVVRTTNYDAAGVGTLTIAFPYTPRSLDGSPASRTVYWPQAVRVRATEAAATHVDGMRVRLTLGEGNKQFEAAVALPVDTYMQKTSLIYPFKGKGIFTNTGVTNGGHRNRSGQFALDGVGLDANYGVYVTGDGTKSTDYADWGRTIVAPAAGVVVEVRTDRPDQPDPEKSDPKYFAPEYPDGGNPGNHVVIDHGNGEFSMLAHMQAGSVLVKLGDHVAQGQALGELGSSGDTTTPHLHYQLQAGRDIVWSDGLPIQFSNIDEPLLVRGTYFEAK